MYKQLFFVPTLILLLAISACNSEKKTNDESTDIQPDTSSLVIKTILYTVPSPFETAMLIKRFNLAFKPELVMEPKQANKLVAEHAIAVNLGIYYTDACYAAVNNEMHLLEEYFEAISKLTFKLNLDGKIKVPGLSSTSATFRNIANTFGKLFKYVYRVANRRQRKLSCINRNRWLD